MIILQALGMAIIAVLGLLIFSGIFVGIVIFMGDHFGDTAEVVTLIILAILLFTIAFAMKLGI